MRIQLEIPVLCLLLTFNYLLVPMGRYVYIFYT